MGTIATLRKRLEGVDEMQVAADSVRDTREGISDAVVLQLSQGIRSDGSDILPDYTERTKEIKKLKGQVTAFVNLNDTGAYWRSIKTDVNGQEIITGSDVPYAEKLNKKYATRKGRLLKPGGRPKQEYIDEKLTPVFYKNMRKATGLK